MKRKIGILLLASMLVAQQVLASSIIYASVANDTATVNLYDNNTKLQDVRTSRLVHVTNGEGNKTSGDGSYDNPYQNIRTALDNIQNGETLVIVGTVQYTRYEVHTDGSALPLYIDKNITIQGADSSSVLSVRSTIQLEANVTFRNMQLELIPETIIGRNSDNSNSRLGFGQLVERGSTIYVAGHELTLDNVRTDSQDIHELCISGGAYKGLGRIGSKSVINLVNQNSSSNKIHAIYSGDYYNNRNMNVEISIHGYLSDTVIHTADINNTLTGNVDVNLYNGSNVTGFNRDNHNGNLNVTLKENYFSAALSLDNVNELVLEENTRVNFPTNANFNVNQVVLNNKAILDFRDMNSNPIVKGNFISDGTIILDSDQTLNVGGEVIGTTKLNDDIMATPYLVEGYQYIIAGKSFNGNFSIDESYYNGLSLEKTYSADNTIWTVTKNPKLPNETLRELQWIDGEDTIIKPSADKTYLYPIKLINEEGNVFKPDIFDFELTLERVDGLELDTDHGVFFDWNYDKNTEDINDINEVKIIFYEPTTAYGELKLTVTHTESKVSISRIIKVLEEELKEDEEEIPTLPEEKPEVDAPETDEPTDKPDVEDSVTPPIVETPGTPDDDTTPPADEKPPVVETPSTPVTPPTVESPSAPVVPPVVQVPSTPTVPPTEDTPTETPEEEEEEKEEAKLTLSKSSATLYTKGLKTVKLTAKVTGESKNVTYKSSNRKVATVNQSGTVTAKGVGTTTITAEVNGVKATCTIVVKKPTLKVKQSNLSVRVGKSKSITASVKPVGNIKFTSSNKKVATVTKNGTVKGKKKGTAKITVECHGIKKTVNVTVKKAASKK